MQVFNPMMYMEVISCLLNWPRIFSPTEVIEIRKMMADSNGPTRGAASGRPLDVGCCSSPPVDSNLGVEGHSTSTRNFVVTSFTLPVAMAYSTASDVRASNPGIAISRMNDFSHIFSNTGARCLDTL
ncbi:hypothetical protein KIN20_031926 [Parelaphostrongylus tenuis]|uniref:Uncharacterized protein n=1 Tax=Parelaphostrongylus tenuis TaxID=148309 RepID=A0AAD5WHC5_PARTN|nr:hypothetical protein KIN20_031926 [Parelaphostrongylus tenuis]